MRPLREGAVLGVWRTILSATGVPPSLWPVGLALVVTVLWHDGMIEAIGPLALAAPLPVVVAVAVLLAVACAVSHQAPRTPVIVRNRRTVGARAVSHLTVLGLGVAVVTLGDILAPGSTLGAATRNLLVLVAPALLTSGLAGPAYAWVPVLLGFGSAVLSNPDESVWTPYALLMSPSATPAQLVVGGALALGGLAVAALDPFDRAYLPRPARRVARRP